MRPHPLPVRGLQRPLPDGAQAAVPRSVLALTRAAHPGAANTGGTHAVAALVHAQLTPGRGGGRDGWVGVSACGSTLTFGPYGWVDTSQSVRVRVRVHFNVCRNISFSGFGCLVAYEHDGL